MIVKLTNLPELQHLDRIHRRHAVLDWWIALWKSWPIFLADFGLWCLALQGVEMLTRMITGISWLQILVRGVLFIPMYYLVSIIRNYAIFMPRREVLEGILKKPEYDT